VSPRVYGHLQCPTCEECIDAATVMFAAPDIRPDVGDVTVCINCAAVLVFERHPFGLQVRHITEAERRD
jgi:hypothetical protein